MLMVRRKSTPPVYAIVLLDMPDYFLDSEGGSLTLSFFYVYLDVSFFYVYLDVPIAPENVLV